VVLKIQDLLVARLRQLPLQGLVLRRDPHHRNGPEIVDFT
jgi:hypothetical protein